MRVGAGAWKRASVYASVFTPIVTTIIVIAPLEPIFKVLLLLIYCSYLFTYLEIAALKDMIVKEIRTVKSRVEIKCHNIDVVEQYETEYACEITVRCRVGLMGHRGCPERCPKFHRPLPTGAGALGGMLVGGLVGTIILPVLGTIALGLIGGTVGHAVEDVLLRGSLERKVDECRAKGRTPYVKYVPSA